MTRSTATITHPPDGHSPAGGVAGRTMTPNSFGLLVGATFGLIDIVANAGVALPSVAATAARALGVATYVLLLVIRRAGGAPTGGTPPRIALRRGYWLIVAAEVTAIGVGKAVLSGPLGAPHAVVAWISLVVGIHFFGLAAVWHAPLIRRLGAAIAVCGVLGLAAAAAGSSAALIAVVAGLAPGVLLLGVSYWGMVQRVSHPGHTLAAAGSSRSTRATGDDDPAPGSA